MVSLPLWSSATPVGVRHPPEPAIVAVAASVFQGLFGRVDSRWATLVLLYHSAIWHYLKSPEELQL